MAFYDGPMIDAHHHLWDLSMGMHPWLAGSDDEEGPINLRPLKRNYLVEDLVRDAANQNLVKSVHIQAGWDRSDPLAETRWIQGLADCHGFPHGIVGDAPLREPGVEAVLEAHARHANMRRIRYILSWHEDPAKRFDQFVDRADNLTDPDWRRDYALLAKFNMSFDVMIYPDQLADTLDLVRAYPGIQNTINHLGSPIDRDEAGMARWREGMKNVASAPNVAVKISDICAYDPDWTVDSYRPIVLSLIDWFGVDRCVFASDFPVATLHGDFDAHYNAFKEIVRDFSATEQRQLFHDNAARLYRLG